MTESEWSVCAKPHPMLEDLEWQGRLSSRKHQLWVCACVKRIGHLLLDERLRAAVIARDMYADDLVTTHELRAAEAAAQKAKTEIPLPPDFGRGILGIVPVAATAWAAFAAVAAVEGSRGFRSVSILVLEAVRCESSSKLQVPVCQEWVEAVNAEEWAGQANLMRDVFGNPFRPAALNPSWRTPTVTNLAEAIYQDEAFGQLPILADALEDVGCTDLEILNHCRQPDEHVRGCWVVDLILKKD
jgi:hypothetical protein